MRVCGTSSELKEEWAITKTHPVVEAQMTAAAPELAPLVPIVCSHHERFDGRGYPDGLKGAEIPLLARLFSVVDTYDAIVSDWPYRAGRSREEAVEVLRNEHDRQFCSTCVDAFLRIPEEQLAAIHRRHALMEMAGI